MDVNNRQGYYRGVLNHLSQTKKIEILSYFNEPEKHDGTRMYYRCHVSLKYLQTKQTITGSSTHVESKSKAQEQAAKDAWSQIQLMMVAPTRVEGRGQF